MMDGEALNFMAEGGEEMGEMESLGTMDGMESLGTMDDGTPDMDEMVESLPASSAPTPQAAATTAPISQQRTAVAPSTPLAQMQSSGTGKRTCSDFRPIPIPNGPNEFKRKMTMIQQPIHHMNYNSKSLTENQRYMWMAALNSLRSAMSVCGVDTGNIARIMSDAYRISFEAASYQMMWVKLAQLMEKQDNAFSNFDVIERVFDQKCMELNIDSDHVKVRIFNGIRRGVIPKDKVEAYEQQVMDDAQGIM